MAITIKFIVYTNDIIEIKKKTYANKKKKKKVVTIFILKKLSLI